MENYDIYFPHLGIGIEQLKNSVSVFGFRIAYYGIIIGIGMLLGTLVASHDYQRRGRKADDIQDFAIYGIILSIIGARIYYVAFEWSYYSQHLGEIINIRQGGLAIYGGVITAFVSCLVFTRLRKISFPDMADSGVLGLILGQAIGRWGNFFNAEAFGGFTNSFLCMRIRESIVNPNMLNTDVISNAVNVGGVDYIQVHPTFLYESCWNLCVFAFLCFMSRRKRFDGQVALCYLGAYGLGRFFIEGLRTDSLLLWGTNIAVSQALSFCLVLIAVLGNVFGLRCRRRAAAKEGAAE